LDSYFNARDEAYQKFTRERQVLWNRIAAKEAKKVRWSSYYHHRLNATYRSIIPAGSTILEVGCGRGDLLAFLESSVGVGVDFSEGMIAAAQEAHPECEFICVDAHALPDLGRQFDFIILSDLVNDVWDVQTVLAQLKPFCTPKTRLVINFYNHLWELPLKVAQAIHMATPLLDQNWLTQQDMRNLLQLCDYEVVRTSSEVLFPFYFPLLSGLFNRVLARLTLFKFLCMTNFLIARPSGWACEDKPSVSVVIAARNEAGNIAQIFERVPEMGSRIELIFVEGHSKDNTYEVIEDIAAKSNRLVQLLKQEGTGKGDAIRLGFQHAQGDVLMILDADLTVPPEDLPRFYDALISNRGEFINGVRLVYPMEKQAMRPFNTLGNKFFSTAFSWMLGQSIKDTLCGTKVLWREDYEKIAANRAFFGDFDPFGDFDLIFGAAKLNLKIVDLPIRYRERTYGTTNIQRWKHGLLLLRMLWVAAVRLKFV
jgi:SAM-dependent methyltransferase